MHTECDGNTAMRSNSPVLRDLQISRDVLSAGNELVDERVEAWCAQDQVGLHAV